MSSGGICVGARESSINGVLGASFCLTSVSAVVNIMLNITGTHAVTAVNY